MAIAMMGANGGHQSRDDDGDNDNSGDADAGDGGDDDDDTDDDDVAVARLGPLGRLVPRLGSARRLFGASLRPPSKGAFWVVLLLWPSWMVSSAISGPS
eukprot:9242005-Pyramimonas_sp.AAC.1